jgi:hypothetical protein
LVARHCGSGSTAAPTAVGTGELEVLAEVSRCAAVGPVWSGDDGRPVVDGAEGGAVPVGDGESDVRPLGFATSGPAPAVEPAPDWPEVTGDDTEPSPPAVTELAEAALE